MQISATLLWLHLIAGGAFVTLGVFLLLDEHCRRVFRTDWQLILLALFLAVAWRLPADGHFFHGLEYEDAYIYTVAGRHVLNGPGLPPPGESRFLTTVCAVGTPTDCLHDTTFSGHFLGLPYVIGLAAKFFGYSPYLGNLVSLFAACASIFLIVLICRSLEWDASATMGAALIFAITPAFAVHGTASFAEPLSSFFVLTILYLYLRVLRSEGRMVWLAGFALALTCLFGVLVKRENALVVVVLAAAAAVELWRRRSTSIALGDALIVICCVITLTFVITQMGLIRMLMNEAAEYGQFSFDIFLVSTLLPLFIRSFATFEWYSVTFLLVVIGLMDMRRLRSGLLYLLFVGFVLTYSLHIRSYYQLNYSDVTKVEMLRYSMNLSGLWALLGGSGIAVIGVRLRMMSRPLWTRAAVATGLVLLVLISLLTTLRTREDFTSEEFEVRIKPALSAIRLAESSVGNKPYIITAEPLLIQMYDRSGIPILDFVNLDQVDVASLLNDPTASFLYIEQAAYLSAANQDRYAKQFEIVNRIPKDRIISEEEYSVFLVRPK